jgi:hypothetical protein
LCAARFDPGAFSKRFGLRKSNKPILFVPDGNFGEETGLTKPEIPNRYYQKDKPRDYHFGPGVKKSTQHAWQHNNMK